MGHLMISAAHKSSGKTTISIGLCRALRGRGLRVQPFKKGPDYIDPLWLGRAAGRPCFNLDFYTEERDEINRSFVKHSADTDIAVVEGNKGLFDGLELDGSNSNAALARQLGAPVLLVLDTRGMTRGVAPLILGYQGFEPEVQIAGVILNNVGGSRHESKLRQVIEHYTDVPVVGAVARDASMQIVERHLGLIPSNEIDAAEQQIERIAGRVADQVDLDAVLEIASKAAPVASPQAPSAGPGLPLARVTIGYAADAAFGFYYPGDLEALRAAGAMLVPFDTLADRQLPQVDGLFIGGGFPESCMEVLAANTAMLGAVKQFVEADGPVYAECGGLMYLGRSLAWNERRCRMANVLPLDLRMHDKPQGRGYVRLQCQGNHPWPGLRGQLLRAHEFHYSGVEWMDESHLEFVYEVQRGHGVDGHRDGIRYRNVLASYCHLRDVRQSAWASQFVQFVAECRERRPA
jgi:cobyrinic acid a,c-diamide synthase